MRNRTAAARLLVLMEATFRMLADFPSAGRARADVHPDVCGFAVGSCVLIYRPVEDGVEIARIADGRHDLTSLFRAVQRRCCADGYGSKNFATPTGKSGTTADGSSASP